MFGRHSVKDSSRYFGTYYLLHTMFYYHPQIRESNFGEKEFHPWLTASNLALKIFEDNISFGNLIYAYLL